MAKVPELVVVLLCIIAGGALVTVLAAFGKSFFGRNEPPEINFNQRSAEQDSYLRRVREMNHMAIWGLAKSHRREERRQREREGSDIEIQSGRSHSNAGVPSTSYGASHNGGYNGGHSGGGGYGYNGGHNGGYNEGYNGSYRPHSSGHPSNGYVHPHGYAQPVAYYEDEYAGRSSSNLGYGESQPQPQQPYTAGHSNLYASSQSKPGPTETWHEVPR